MLYQIQKHFFEPLLSPIFQDFYVILILHTTLPSKRILLSGMKKKALNQSQYLKRRPLNKRRNKETLYGKLNLNSFLFKGGFVAASITLFIIIGLKYPLTFYSPKLFVMHFPH